MSAESQDKTRRGFLKRSVAGGATAGASTAGLLPQIADAQARGDATLDRLQKARKILLKGGIVMSLDPAVGDFAKADC
jgi:5-methylthioadenosine/S-adenosylhomocysteine deaminase